MYDYKSSLTGIDNRSSVDNFDDTIFSFIIVLWICNKRQKWRQCVLTRYLITRVSANTRSREQFARIIRVSVKRPLDRPWANGLTPCRHEDGHCDRGVVVEDPSDPRVVAAVVEVAVVTKSVTLGTHHRIPSLSVTDLVAAPSPSAS